MATTNSYESRRQGQEGKDSVEERGLIPSQTHTFCYHAWGQVSLIIEKSHAGFPIVRDVNTRDGGVALTEPVMVARRATKQFIH